MQLSNIFDRLQTIFEILNPSYKSSIAEIEHKYQVKDQQQIQYQINKLIDQFQNWLMNDFNKQYQKYQCYSLLELQLQKCQNTNRQHIRMEEQLRIYGENITNQMETLEKNYLQLDRKAKKTIQKLKIENEELKEEILVLKQSVVSKKNKKENHQEYQYYSPIKHTLHKRYQSIPSSITNNNNKYLYILTDSNKQ